MLAFNKYLDHYKGLSSLIWKGIIVSLIESSMVAICYFLTLYFVSELHFNIAYAGMIMSAYGVGTILGAFIAGKLSDEISPNSISIASLLLQSTAFLLLTKLHSLPFILCDLFLLGIASYGFITSNQVWVLAQCTDSEQQRLKAINILGVASNLGLGIASLIIGMFGMHHFIGIFYFCSFSLCCIAIYLISLELHHRKNVILPDTANNISSNTEVAAPKNNPMVILFALSSLFIAGIIISQLSATYSIYLQQHFPTMGVKSFSFLFTINTLMVVLLQTPIANHLGHKDKIRGIGFGVFILGFGMLLLNAAYYFLIAVIACIVMTLGEIIFFSLALSLCYEYSAPQKKGRAIGNYRVVFAASRIAGPLLGGIIYHQFGGNALWYFCGLLGLACLIASIKVKEKLT